MPEMHMVYIGHKRDYSGQGEACNNLPSFQIKIIVKFNDDNFLFWDTSKYILTIHVVWIFTRIVRGGKYPFR